jgi:hypothetical protein
MTDDNRRDVAGILARGFDDHVETHGPDGSYAVRDGRLYEVTERDGASVARVFYEGRYYSVTVTDDGPVEMETRRRQNVIISGSTGVQYGDGNSQTNMFGGSS